MPTSALPETPACLAAHLRRRWNALLPIITYPTASVARFMPDYYPRPVTLLVSCYALFE